MLGSHRDRVAVQLRVPVHRHAFDEMSQHHHDVLYELLPARSARVLEYMPLKHALLSAPVRVTEQLATSKEKVALPSDHVPPIAAISGGSVNAPLDAGRS